MEVRLFTVLRSRVELRSQVLEFLRRVRKSADYALSLSPFHHRRSRKTWERKRRNFSRRPTQITAVLESHRNKHSRKPIHGGEVGAENPSRKQTMKGADPIRRRTQRKRKERKAGEDLQRLDEALAPLHGGLVEGHGTAIRPPLLHLPPPTTPPRQGDPAKGAKLKESGSSSAIKNLVLPFRSRREGVKEGSGGWRVGIEAEAVPGNGLSDPFPGGRKRTMITVHRPQEPCWRGS